MQKLKMIWENPRNVYDYFLGNYRYWLYYKDNYPYKEQGSEEIIWRKHFLMRRHIWEQIRTRIQWMDKECYDNGSCRICGCQTTALQMANKFCDKPCYPYMMNRREWESFKRGSVFTDRNGKWIYNIVKHKLELLKLTRYGFRVVYYNETKPWFDKA